MPTIYVENQPYKVPAGQNLLAACLALGFDLPYFCWHPAMGSVGACRQCAVKKFKDEDDTEGEIVMACLTPADDGVRISIDDPEAKAFRAAVSEWLMASHPHDCPVCDEGGECHLQDMTVMTGHIHRRYDFQKRTFENQDLGPFIEHEMNRCIQCYRCVRFYSDYAGGRDFAAMGSRNTVYFGRAQDGKLESEFSGNLVEVCPTGVFTDKTQKDHFVRAWDLQTAPSICVHCGLGCNTIPGERDGVLRRIRNRYNGAVNGYFLCDRGRFGYEFVNADTRVREVKVGVEKPAPPARRGGVSGPAAAAADLISEALARGGKVVGIGSPRASLEANHALRRLVGADYYFAGLAERELELLETAVKILLEGPSRSCSLRDVESADAMIIIAEDVTNTAPMLDYSIRQWIRRRPTPEQLGLNIPAWNDAAVGEIVHETPSPLYIATVQETKLDRIAAHTYRATPPDIARFAYAVAHLLDKRAPAVRGLPKDILDHAKSAARSLAAAERPIIVSGVSPGSQQILRAAANLAWSLCDDGGSAELALVVPECNSLGVALMGGGSLEEAFDLAVAPGIDVAIVLENDLYRRASEKKVNQFLRGCKHVVVLDHTESGTAQGADMVLPAATFAESTGTLVNNEGRAQRYFSVMPQADPVCESWRWLCDIQRSLDGGDPAGSIDSLTEELAAYGGPLRRLAEVAPDSSFRVAGMKVARRSHRFSGRAAIDADRTVFEPPLPIDGDSALSFGMEGFTGQPPSALVPRIWSPGWNSSQALSKFQEPVNGAMIGGDAGVRLLEPADVEQPPHYLEIPAPVPATGEGTYVVGVHHIFGSDEMSMRSPRFPAVAPEPYVGLSPGAASGLEVADGDTVSVQTADLVRDLPVKIIDSLPAGVAVLPVGLPGLEGVIPPFQAQIVNNSGARSRRADPGDDPAGGVPGHTGGSTGV